MVDSMADSSWIGLMGGSGLLRSLLAVDGLGKGVDFLLSSSSNGSDKESGDGMLLLFMSLTLSEKNC